MPPAGGVQFSAAFAVGTTTPAWPASGAGGQTWARAAPGASTADATPPRPARAVVANMLPASSDARPRTKALFASNILNFPSRAIRDRLAGDTNLPGVSVSESTQDGRM